MCDAIPFNFGAAHVEHAIIALRHSKKKHSFNIVSTYYFEVTFNYINKYNKSELSSSRDESVADSLNHIRIEMNTRNRITIICVAYRAYADD